VVESFIDELAAAAKRDPFEYRRALLDRSPRAKAVLELARSAPAGAAGTGGRWARHRAAACLRQLRRAGRGRHGVEAGRRAGPAGGVRRGLRHVVNPDIVKAQMESGIVFGITAALWGEITIKNGRVEQHNFHDYRMLHMSEAPAIEVHLVRSTEAPGGSASRARRRSCPRSRTPSLRPPARGSASSR